MAAWPPGYYSAATALPTASAAAPPPARGHRVAADFVNFISGVLPGKARLDTAGVVKVNCTWNVYTGINRLSISRIAAHHSSAKVTGLTQKAASWLNILTDIPH